MGKAYHGRTNEPIKTNKKQSKCRYTTHTVFGRTHKGLVTVAAPGREGNWGLRVERN